MDETNEKPAPVEVPEPYRKLDADLRAKLGVGLADLEPVQPAEVALSAKANCKKCFGKGSVQVLTKKDGQDVRVPRMCTCGLLRFVKTHNDELMKIGDRLFWKPKKPGQGPTRGDATRIASRLEGDTLTKALEELGLSGEVPGR